MFEQTKHSNFVKGPILEANENPKNSKLKPCAIKTCKLSQNRTEVIKLGIHISIFCYKKKLSHIAKKCHGKSYFIDPKKPNKYRYGMLM